MAAWPAAIWFTERTDRCPPGDAPATVAIADPRYSAAISKGREHVQAMLAQRQIPGMAVAVAVEGRIVWSEGFGYADRDKRVPVTAQTKFRIQSVSKTLTTAALARLHEAGRIDLDAPIQTYVPSFPDKGHVITARQLASHRAGIRAYRDDNEALNTKHYRTVTESLEEFRDDPLEFVPDSEFLYSGYGYVLLSAAIEGAAGEDFLSCMRRTVFVPLAMSDTVEDRVDEPAPHQSKSHDIETPYSLDGTMVESPRIDFSCKYAAGGFLSTAEDLVRFGSAFIQSREGSYLQPQTLELLFAPRSRQGGLIGYGLGWMTARDLHLRRVCFNFGAGSGGSSVLAVYPEVDVSIALLANLGHAQFSMERLFGMTNPFLSDPAWYVITGFWACVLVGCMVRVWTWIHARRARIRTEGSAADAPPP